FQIIAHQRHEHARFKSRARIRIRTKRTAGRIDLLQRCIQLRAGMKLPSARVALQLTNTRTAVRKQNVDRHRRSQGEDRRNANAFRKLEQSRETEAMPLIVWRWSKLVIQIV